MGNVGTACLSHGSGNRWGLVGIALAISASLFSGCALSKWYPSRSVDPDTLLSDNDGQRAARTESIPIASGAAESTPRGKAAADAAERGPVSPAVSDTQSRMDTGPADTTVPSAQRDRQPLTSQSAWERSTADLEQLRRELEASRAELPPLVFQQLMGMLEKRQLEHDGSLDSRVVPLRPSSQGIAPTYPSQSTGGVAESIGRSVERTGSADRDLNSRSQDLSSTGRPPLTIQRSPPVADHRDAPRIVEETASPPMVPPTTRNAATTTDEAGDRVDSANNKAEEFRWQSRVRQALDSIDRELATSAKDLPEADRVRLEIQSRILQLLLDRREGMLKEISGLPAEQRDYWKYQLRTISILLDERGTPSQSRRTALALREIQSASRKLASQSALDVHRLTFCSAVDGFGTLTEFSKAEFSPGQEVLLYLEVDHFISEPTSSSDSRSGTRNAERYETELRATYQLVDAYGRRVVETELPVDKQTCGSPRRDYFIAYHIYLPKTIEPGAYSLQLTMEDVKGKKFGQGSIEFTIKGKP